MLSLSCIVFFDRVVAEVNIDRKHKPQKAKVKTSESRKQLSTVRVIQRNLVYVVGLPFEFADEDVRSLLLSFQHVKFILGC